MVTIIIWMNGTTFLMIQLGVGHFHWLSLFLVLFVKSASLQVVLTILEPVIQTRLASNLPRATCVYLLEEQIKGLKFAPPHLASPHLCKVHCFRLFDCFNLKTNKQTENNFLDQVPGPAIPSAVVCLRPLGAQSIPPHPASSSQSPGNKLSP